MLNVEYCNIILRNKFHTSCLTQQNRQNFLNFWFCFYYIRQMNTFCWAPSQDFPSSVLVIKPAKLYLAIWFRLHLVYSAVTATKTKPTTTTFVAVPDASWQQQQQQQKWWQYKWHKTELIYKYHQTRHGENGNWLKVSNYATRKTSWENYLVFRSNLAVRLYPTLSLKYCWSCREGMHYFLSRKDYRISFTETVTVYKCAEMGVFMGTPACNRCSCRQSAHMCGIRRAGLAGDCFSLGKYPNEHQMCCGLSFWSKQLQIATANEAWLRRGWNRNQ